MNALTQELENFANTLAGRIDFEKAAKDWTWLRVGGKPLFTYYPQDMNALKSFCANVTKNFDNLPYRTLGAASNLLVRDNGFNGIFIRLAKGFRDIEIINNNQIIASAGLLGSYITNFAAEKGLGNIAFMATIPGMLGGLIKMNAGAHNMEMKDIIEWVEIIDETGKLHRLSNEDCAFSYRKSDMQNNWIIIRACINAQPQKQEEIYHNIEELTNYRKKTQPTNGKMAGCFFKNPVTQTDKKAWEFVKETNLTSENVAISEIHANFIVNKENATAYDLEYFAKKIQAKVWFEKNIWLPMEIERIGY